MKIFKRILLSLLSCAALLVSDAISAQLHADFTSTSNSGCPPMVVNFFDSSTGSPTAWKWDLGNGTVSFLQDPVATYFNPGTYNVKLVVTNSSGKDSVIKNQFVTVYSLPDAKFTPSDTVGCFPLKVNFTDNSVANSGTITNWQWDFGDGNLSNDQSPQHIYRNSGNYTVILRVINSNGCSKVITKPALIKTLNGVKAEFTYSSVQGCTTPAAVSFTNTSSGTGTLSYMWQFGDGATSTAQNPVHNYLNGGSYTPTIIVKNSFGCADTLTKTNAINIGFVRAIMNIPDTACAGQSFTAINVSNPSTFVGTTWNFGQGTTATTSSYVMKYTSPGTYLVKMVTDFGACNDSVTKQIVVLAKPKAVFIANNVTACNAPLTVTFVNSSVGGVTYQWQFGDSTTSTSQNPVHTYTVAGVYSVKLVVTNSAGCQDSIEKRDFIVIAPPEILRIDSLPLKGCLPFTITPKVVMKDSIAVTSYQWNFGDGATSTLANPTHTYTVPGSYTVKVIVVTGPGCTDTLIIADAVKVGNKPHINFSATPRDACASTTITFSDLSTMSNGGLINDWFWQFGDGGTSTDQNPTYNYNDTGYFNVTLYAYNYGCSDTLMIPNYMHILPPIAIFDTAFFCNDPMKRRFIDKSIGPLTWAWNFGDGATSTAQNPSHIYADTGIYKVSLKVTNGACDYTKKMDVPIINEKPVLTTTDTTSCILTRIKFEIIGTRRSNIQSYIWLPYGLGNDSIVNVSYAIAQYYNTAGTRNVAVVLTDILNCRDTVFTIAPIRTYGPKANYSSSIKNICYGSTINFFDSSTTDGIHPIVEWKWNFGDSTIKSYTTGPFSHFYSTQGLFNVTLYVKDAFGCKDSMVKPGLITISKPVAKFTPSDTMLCPNTTVTFTNQSQASGGIYTWSFGDGNISHDFSPVYNYGQPGVYLAKMIVVDKNGCSDSASVTIRVFTAHAAFTLSDSFSTCPPLIVNITNQASNYIQFNWDFGDGGNSQLINPSHIYTYPGNYSVKLIVRNNGGCVDSMVKNVIIQGPTGTFGYIPTTICNPGQINYSLISNNTAKYVWDFDDGTTVFTTVSSTSHIYTTPGLYLPKVILENSSGCRVPVLGLDTVKVIGIQTNILSNKRSLCDSGIISFRDSTVTNDNLPIGIMWNFGDGNTSTASAPTHFYSHPGTFTITLLATSNFGCRDSATEPQYIQILTSPKVKITGDTTGCAPAKLKFVGTLLSADTSGLTWSWSFGNGKTSNLQLPDSQLYNSSGSYNIRLKVVNAGGCSDTSAMLRVVLHPKPTVYAGADTSLCRFAPHTLQASGASTYNWLPDPTLSCLNCANPVATPVATTTYYVIGTSPFGCTNTDSVTLGIKQPFKMIVGNGDTICIGKSVPLSASGAGSYQWTPAQWLDNSTSANPTSTPDSTITYQVVGSDNANCFKDTGTVKIKVYKIPSVDITNPASVNVIVGGNIQLNTTASADVLSYSWTPGQWLSCANCPNPLSVPKDNVTYKVTVTNAGNCTASDAVTITLICNDGNVYIPNTFSPNDDGANDIFYPRGRGVNLISNFTIFNRWGQVVFHRSRISANDEKNGWNGMVDGVKMPTDVYVYLLEVICANNTIFPIKGNVTLLR